MDHCSPIIDTYHQLLDSGYMSDSPEDLYQERPLFCSSISRVESNPVISIRTEIIANQISQHYHSFILLTHGHGYWINDASEVPLGAGSALFIQARNRFTFHFPTSYRALSFNVPSQLLHEYFQTAPKHGTLIHSAPPSLITQLEKLNQNPDHPDGTIALRAAEHSLMSECRNAFTIAGPQLNSRAEAIKKTIRNHATDEDFCIDWLAQQCNASRRYLFKLFEDTGITLNQYIHKIQLTHAFGLLSNPDAQHLPINDIAISSGFKTQAHFSRLFKERYQITPSLLRSALNQTQESF